LSSWSCKIILETFFRKAINSKSHNIRCKSAIINVVNDFDFERQRLKVEVVSNLLALTIDTWQARLESIINTLSPKLWPANTSQSSTKSFGSVEQSGSFTYHPLICLASNTHTWVLPRPTNFVLERLVLVYSRFWPMCITHLYGKQQQQSLPKTFIHHGSWTTKGSGDPQIECPEICNLDGCYYRRQRQLLAH